MLLEYKTPTLIQSSRVPHVPDSSQTLRDYKASCITKSFANSTLLRPTTVGNQGLTGRHVVKHQQIRLQTSPSMSQASDTFSQYLQNIYVETEMILRY